MKQLLPKTSVFSIRMSSSLLKRLLLMVASVVQNRTTIRVTLLCGWVLFITWCDRFQPENVRKAPSVPLSRDWRCYFVRRPLWRDRLQRRVFSAMPPLVGLSLDRERPFFLGKKWGCSSDSLRYHRKRCATGVLLHLSRDRGGVCFGRVTEEKRETSSHHMTSWALKTSTLGILWCVTIPTSRAAKQGVFKRGGAFPDLDLSFFVLLCPFWDFPDLPGIFPICPAIVRGFSRFVPFLLLGLLTAATRNSPERVRDTIRTFPTKKWEPPWFGTPPAA